MNVAVIGSGAFGFSMALMLNKNKNKVVMWCSTEDKVKQINAGKLEIIKGITIPSEIKFTSSYEEAVKNADLVFLIPAAKYIKDVCIGIKPYVSKKIVYCIGSKGIEQGSCEFVHEVFKRYIKTNNFAVISGPSFAIDVAHNEPIGFSLASKSKTAQSTIIKALASDTIKLRPSHDLIGTELCGSIKNVIAVAAGMLNGMGYNESTRSFLIVESMHDIKELIKGLGGKKKTILSFAGIGDLLLTCTSTKSRNYSYGVLLGKKDFVAAKEYLDNNTVEGYYTLKSIYTLIKRKKIKMPVIDLIYKIVMKNENPSLLVNFLINKE